MNIIKCNNLKLNDINIFEIENVMRIYLTDVHPITSNGIFIRIGDKMNNQYEKRDMFIISFPLMENNNDIHNIIYKWSEFIVNYYNIDLTRTFTIVSIDPISISNINHINIQYSGTSINPEYFIREVANDIIEQMNKHLIEKYMDDNYPEIDIDDIDQQDKYNEILNQTVMEDIYKTFKYAEIYIPIQLNDSDIEFYLNGCIQTDSKVIDIINDIRKCLSFDNSNEIFKYDKTEIVYKFLSLEEGKLMEFDIITEHKN
jgi:hypothetical protein